MTKNFKLCFAALVPALALAACSTTDPQQYRADTFPTGQLNRSQQVRIVNIEAVMPVKVSMDNSQSRKDNASTGALVGAIAGAVIGSAAHHGSDHRSRDTLLGALAGGAVGGVASSAASGQKVTYTDGVQITYSYKGQVYSSTQVGQVCEFKEGRAMMVSTSATETRIQSNNPNGCPAAAK